MPAYNAERFIGESITSILNQDFSDFELLVIDDSSSDSTPEIVQSMAANDPRIRLVRNPKNLGVGGTRAVGVENAKGEFIAWQDADDISEPNRLSSQISVLESDPNIGVVGGFIQFFSGKYVGKTRRYASEDKLLRSRIFRQNPIAHPVATFRSSVYKEIGNYIDLRLSEDIEMCLRVGTRYKFANVQEVLVRYRQVDSSLTRATIRQMEWIAISLRFRYKGHAAYNFGLYDWLFLVGQTLTLWMSPQLRIWLFSVMRGDRK
jgi:glycosyltransferase involved in cell wall biosynthesis